jgi:Na+-transporting NADH:ubiquinone oxidoreductase subunit NqrB
MNFRVEMTNPHVKEKSYKTFFSSLKFELILRANLKGLHIIYGLTRIAVWAVEIFGAITQTRLRQNVRYKFVIKFKCAPLLNEFV